jgi:hypothetical protein
MMNSTRYPTPEEMDAMVLAAHRARAQAIAGMLAAAARGLKAWFAQLRGTGGRAPGQGIVDAS